MISVVDKLRQFDAYPKTADDFKIKTFSGATSLYIYGFLVCLTIAFLHLLIFFTVTIISTIIIISLFVSELRDFISPNVVEELFVDTSRDSKLKINLDIIIPTISCDCKYIFTSQFKMEFPNKIIFFLYLFRSSVRRYGFFRRTTLTN